MLKKLLSIIVVVVLLSSLFSFAGMQEVQAAGNTYYVATTGNDTTGDGSIGNPWKTIQKAASTMMAGDTCIIRGGTYRETVTPANSGTSGNPIKFQAYAGETVTVSGADLVTGWTQYSGSIYKATKTLNLGDQNQIFVDGQMMNEARWPNTGLDLLNPTLATADTGTQTSITDDALIPLGIDWTGANVWSSIGHRWTAQTGAVTGYNASTGTINFNAFGVTGGYNGFLNPKAGSPYYLYGKLEALDIATEWFYNNSITTLYLWAPNGGDLSNHTVEAKARTYAFDLSNRNYIEISGVKIFASTITMANATYSKLTSIEAKYVSHFASLTKYTEHYYDSGIIVSGNNNEIRNSTIAYSAGNGITIFDGSNNRVINSLIRDVDYSGTNDSGIVLAGKDHAVSNSTIYNCGRAAVMPGGMKGGWIQYNDLYNAGMLTDDVGVIYEWQGDGQNAEIHHNFIHDNKALDYPAGIYLDNGSSNWILHHNVIWNSKWNGIVLNSPNNLTLVYNNTLYNKANIAGWVPDDLYGTQVFNNIMTDPVGPEYDVFSSNSYAVSGNNLNPGNDPKFVDVMNKNFHLQSISPAIDEGRVVPGITDGYVGSAPDIGAYEYGGADWTAGHNFITPPDPTFTTVDTPYMNRVKNAGFELTGDMATMMVDTYFETSEPVVDFKFYASKDNVTYTEFTPIRTDLGGYWKRIKYESSSLPEGTKYLKIEFRNTGISWTPQISRVQIGYARGDVVVDEMNDFTNMYSHTANLAFDSSNTSYFNGDTSRLYRTTSTYENIVYSTKSISLDSWTKTNSSTATVVYDLPPVSRSGASCVQLGSAEDGIEQVVSGLSPNTVYTLSGWAKAAVSGEEVRIGVKDYGGPDKYASITGTDWTRGTVTFTTGATNSSAKIYLYKPSSTNSAYGDDFGVIKSSDTSTDTIIDELNDFTKMYSHTANLTFDTSNPGYFNGDASRLTRTTATYESIVYRTPGIMTTMLVDTYFETSEPIVDFKFYASGDGVTYNEFIPARTNLGGYWNRIQYDSSLLPLGTRYLKIEFRKTSGYVWNPNISRVEIGYVKGDVIIDEMNDFTKMYAHTANLTFDTSNPGYFNGDASRLCRTTSTYENIVYRTTGNITTMFVDTYFPNNGDPVVDFKFYASRDGVTYSEFTPVRTDLGGDWKRIKYESSSLPIGTRYLKIEFRNTSANAWNPNLSRLEIGYIKGDVLVDEMNNFTKMYSHTANLTFDTSNPGYFNGDTSRLTRTTATYENIVYSTSGTMTTMLVDTYFETSETVVDFKFYTSGDGLTYNEYIPTKTDLGGYWKCIKYESSSLPLGTRYLKIEFRKTTGYVWNPNISRVEIGYIKGDTIVDELNDFTKMYSHTANLTFDLSNPGYFNGDASRLTRTTATYESIVYKTSGNMTTMLVDAYFETSEPVVDFKFYTSGDGMTYNEYIPVKTDLGGYWNRIKYESSSLPFGTRYLKIEFRKTSGYAWNPNLSRVEIGYVKGDTIVDEMNDFTKMYSRTANLTFDTSNPSNFNGDTSRLCRTILTYENIVYKTTGYMTTILLDTYFETSQPIVDFKFYVSGDGKFYIEYVPIKTDLGGYWNRIKYESLSLPSGTKYLKIEFRNNTGYSWTPHISRLEIGYDN